MDSQSAIALDGGMEMAVSVPRHCHGPTIVAGAEDDDGDHVDHADGGDDGYDDGDNDNDDDSDDDGDW